jgi:hypothetical protein
LEHDVALYGRQLLLAAVLQDKTIGSDMERANMFLEVYGNLVLRAKTAIKIKELAKVLKEKVKILMTKFNLLLERLKVRLHNRAKCRV